MSEGGEGQRIPRRPPRVIQPVLDFFRIKSAWDKHREEQFAIQEGEGALKTRLENAEREVQATIQNANAQGARRKAQGAWGAGAVGDLNSQVAQAEARLRKLRGELND